MALPVVATSVPGCVDAVDDEVTGLLVPPRDAQALAAAIDRYADDEQLRSQHGSNGRDRVMREFRQEQVWEAVLREYRDLTKAERA